MWLEVWVWQTHYTSVCYLTRVRSGELFEHGQLIERPDESGGDQQAAAPGRP